MKIIHRIAKLLRIKFCQCGKCIWWSKEILKWSDDPNDDECGYIAPICQRCISFTEKEI